MNFKYFEYIESEEMSFGAMTGDFISVLGSKNNEIVNNLMYKNPNEYIVINYMKITKKNLDKLRKLVSFSSFSMIDTFLAETVRDELAYSLESLAVPKHEMMSRIESIGIILGLTKLMEKSPKSLSISSKAKLLIGVSLITNPRVVVLDNILSLLDVNDYEKVTKALHQYTKNNGIILNFTSEIEETLLGTDIIITSENKILLSGKTESVLNEEKLMKRLGYNLPFIVQLNKYLKDYELIRNYNLSYERLVDTIWI